MHQHKNLKDEKKEIADYFRSSIFEALSAYTLWETVAFSRSSAVVGEELAKKYVEIQNYHGAFFHTIERTALITFIMLVLQPFDPDKRSYSLYKLNKVKTDKFILDNKDALDQLFLVRNKVFAHKDFGIQENTLTQYHIPPVSEIDIFLENLIKFYNELTKDIDQSYTYFTNATDIKFDIENIFQNLTRGEIARRMEIDIEYFWDMNKNTISNKIKNFQEQTNETKF